MSRPVTGVESGGEKVRITTLRSIQQCLVRNINFQPVYPFECNVAIIFERDRRYR